MGFHPSTAADRAVASGDLAFRFGSAFRAHSSGRRSRAAADHPHDGICSELLAASVTRKIRMRWHIAGCPCGPYFGVKAAFFGREPTVRGERHASHGTYACCRVGDLLRGFGFSRVLVWSPWLL